MHDETVMPTEADGECPFEGGERVGPTLDELADRGAFLLAQRARKAAAERHEAGRAALRQAALAASAMACELPACLRPFVGCAISGENASMYVHVRLPDCPGISCHLEPIYGEDPGCPALPAGYTLPRRPGRHWRVEGVDETYETVEEAVAAARGAEKKAAPAGHRCWLIVDAGVVDLVNSPFARKEN